MAVTFPRGFVAGTASCGIKAFTAGSTAIPSGQKKDLCVVQSDVRGRLVSFMLLLFLLFSRFVMASGGGPLLTVELPALIFLGIQALWVIGRVLRRGA